MSEPSLVERVRAIAENAVNEIRAERIRAEILSEFSEKQPRVPKGKSTGGQFASKKGGGKGVGGNPVKVGDTVSFSHPGTGASVRGEILASHYGRGKVLVRRVGGRGEKMVLSRSEIGGHAQKSVVRVGSKVRWPGGRGTVVASHYGRGRALVRHAGTRRSEEVVQKKDLEIE